MEKITSMTQLKENILLIELKQKMEYVLLKEQVNLTYESLKPINLIKKLIHQAIETPDLKNNVMNNVMGIAAGYLSKKAAVGNTHNPIKNVLGTLLQMTATGIVARNGDGIKSGVINLISSFMQKRKQLE